MAELKSLIVNGVSRLNSTAYAKNVYADKIIVNGGSSSQFLKADGTLDSTAYSPTSHTHSYLPLSGGQLTGTLLVKTSTSNWTEGIRLLDASNGWTTLAMGGSASSGTGENTWTMHTYQGAYYLALNGSSSYTYGLTWTKAGALSIKTSSFTNNGNTIWHAGNDGSGSGLDADLLDGNHASAFATSGHNHDSTYVSALGTSGNYLTWTKNGYTNNITVPFATTSTTASYPLGFSARQNTNNWPGISNTTLLTAWRDTVGTGEIAFVTNGSGQVSCAVDGFFYQGIDTYGSSKKVLDESNIIPYGNRNNAASKIVTTDANGYIQAGWINITSGEFDSSPARIYASTDGYIRYITPANLVKYLYPYEAKLQWGGQNYSGSYGPIDAAMVPELGANRMAFLPASCISVEYSRDGGSTWTTYSTSNEWKMNFFTGIGSDAGIGANDSSHIATNQYQVRIQVYTSGALYTVLNKFVVYVSTNGTSSNWCTIRARTQQNYVDNVDTWSTFANKAPLSGWSGYNVINTSGLTTYGNTAASQYGQIQFIFGCDTGSTSQYTGLRIYKIFGFGGVGWTIPSTMAKTGHLYTYNYAQDAVFPASITSTGFAKSGSSNNYVLLGGGSHKAVSDFATSGHTHDGRYLRWGGSAADVNAMSWGTLTAANGYTIVSHASSSDGGDWGMTYKNGQIFMQLDGYYYQNEGAYRVTDVSETVTALGTSGNYLTWTKNGSTNNITVPYATSAGSASSVAWSNVSGRPLYWANVALQANSDPATGPTFSYATFTRTSNHGISVGTIRGTAVNNQTGEYIHMYERVHIGSPSGWGSKSAPANGLSTYGGAWLATDTGNVGIGTTTTNVKLQVAGSLAVINDSSNTTYDALAYFRTYAANDWGMIIDKNNAYSYGLYIKSNGTYALSVTGGSRLQGATCIGADAAASYTCDVRGNVRATTEVRSDNGNFYAGSASGSQCHMQYDNTTKCMKFIFD